MNFGARAVGAPHTQMVRGRLGTAGSHWCSQSETRTRRFSFLFILCQIPKVSLQSQVEKWSLVLFFKCVFCSTTYELVCE